MAQAFPDPGLIAPPGYINPTTPAFAQSGQTCGFLGARGNITYQPAGASNLGLTDPFFNTTNFTLSVTGSPPTWNVRLICNTSGVYTFTLNFTYNKGATTTDGTSPALNVSVNVYNSVGVVKDTNGYNIPVAKNNTNGVYYPVSLTNIISVSEGDYVKIVSYNNTGNSQAGTNQGVVQIYDNNDAPQAGLPANLTFYLTYLQAI
jgi:hypothetical protein